MTSASPPTGHVVNAWLAMHCRAVAGTRLGAVVLHGTQGPKLVAVHPPGSSVPAWVAQIALAAATSNEPTEQAGVDAQQRPVHLVAHPLRWEGLMLGASVLALDGALPFSEANRDVLARSASGFPGAAAPQQGEITLQHSHAVLRLLLSVRTSSSVEQAAASVATTLAGLLQCDRVSVGVRRGPAISILGSSDGWEQQPTSLLAEVAAAMDESLDEAACVVYPPAPGGTATLIAAHAHLSNNRESRALCSIPLADRDGFVGAVLAERANGHLFTPSDVALLEMAGAGIAQWLSMRQQLDLHWAQDLRRRMAVSMARVGKGRHRLAALVSVSALAAFFCWPVDREIRAPVKLEGAVQRLIAAPGDSYLEQVMVRPGDVVEAGQLLVAFASEDLRVERERLLAELGGRQTAATDAMAKQDLTTLALNAAKAGEAQAQLALLDQRLARSRIVAPFDAVVIQGDLRNALGAPTRKGDLLMTLAPLDQFKAIVEIDDTDIGEVHVGQPGRMLLTAAPDQEVALRVKRVIPMATTAPGRSYFEVEVEVEPGNTGERKLRPGMRGIARLEAGREARAFVWTEQIAAWARLMWWRWIG